MAEYTQVQMVADPAASLTVSLDGAVLTTPIAAKEWATGTKGYTYAGKVAGADGRQYQVSLNVYLVHSASPEQNAAKLAAKAEAMAKAEAKPTK